MYVATEMNHWTRYRLMWAVMDEQDVPIQFQELDLTNDLFVVLVGRTGLVEATMNHEGDLTE